MKMPFPPPPPALAGVQITDHPETDHHVRALEQFSSGWMWVSRRPKDTGLLFTLVPSRARPAPPAVPADNRKDRKVSTR